MKKINISLIALATVILSACGSESSTEKTTAESAPVEKSTETICTFDYDLTATKITWKSFKTSARVAVGGTFNEFTVNNTVASNSESAVFENATFQIITASVNTGNVERDPKLIKFFFNQMIQTDTISGGIVKISEAVEGKGAAIMSITMNGVTHEENAIYTLEGTVLTLSATINMGDWDASSAITSLNNECKVLHTGDDGISKLWEEVEVAITTTLTKTCE